MQRFFLPPTETRGDTLTLSTREAHHALNVLRLRPGETVMVLNGAGERLTCEAADLSRREVTLRVRQREFVPAPIWSVTLIQAVPKGKTFDTIVQKATELGAHRIIPLLSHRVVSQIDPDRNEGKVDHWRAIALESIKQCGSPWMPVIEPPVTLADLWPRLETADLRLVASLRSSAVHPRAALTPVLGAMPPGRGGKIQIWVGPEGDFTEEELDAIEAAGARPVTLGSLVLRADTAAIYCLSIVNYETQGQRIRDH